MTGKRKKNEDKVSLLEIMTISLFIILLAFFILLNSISEIDEEKQEAAVGSINENFGGKTMIEQGANTQKEHVFSNGVSPVDFSDLVTDNDKQDDGLDIKVTNKTTTLSIAADKLFYHQNMTLKRQAYPLLDKVSTTIQKNAMAIEITAHTDNIPIPSFKNITNRELSTLQSIDILKYFIVQKKIEPQRFIACGWGKHKPIASNRTLPSRQLNRRVDITFVHDRPLNKGKGIFIFKDFFFNVSE